MTATSAHLTTAKESQAVEDKIETIARHSAANGDAAPPDAAAVLAEIDATLARLEVDYLEWEVLYRKRLQVERDLLIGAPVGEAGPGVPGPMMLGATTGANIARGEWLFAGALAAIMAIDLGLAAWERMRSRR